MKRTPSDSRNSGGLEMDGLIRKARSLSATPASDLGQLFRVPSPPTSLRMFLRSGDDFMRAQPHVNLDSHVLLIALHGEAEVVLDDLALRIQPGEALLIFPGERHHYQNPRGAISWLFLNIQIAQEDDWLVLKRSVVALNPPIYALLDSCLEQYLHAFSGRQGWDTGDPAQSLRVWLLLDALRKRAWSESSAPETGSMDLHAGNGHRLVWMAHEYMLTNLHRPITVRTIAAELGVSPTVLQSLFHTHHQSSVGRVLRRLRVNRAARLIRASDTPLKVIASECGFSSPATLSRTFKQSTGFPPATYRRRSSPLGAGRDSS